jgi:hypothetical protein
MCDDEVLPPRPRDIDGESSDQVGGDGLGPVCPRELGGGQITEEAVRPFVVAYPGSAGQGTSPGIPPPVPWPPRGC